MSCRTALAPKVPCRQKTESCCVRKLLFSSGDVSVGSIVFGFSICSLSTLTGISPRVGQPYRVNGRGTRCQHNMPVVVMRNLKRPLSCVLPCSSG